MQFVRIYLDDLFAVGFWIKYFFPKIDDFLFTFSVLLFRFL